MILKSMCTQKAQKFFWQKTTFYDTELFFMCLLYVHTFDIWPGLRGFDIYLSFGLNRFLIYGFIKNPREGSWKSPFSWFLAFLAVFFAEKGCVFSTKNLVEKDSLFQQKIAKKAKNHENGDFHEPPRGFLMKLYIKNRLRPNERYISKRLKPGRMSNVCAYNRHIKRSSVS